MSDVTITSDILSQYWNVIVGGDIMFISKLPFFVKISCNLKFSTAELMLDQKHHTLIKHIKHVHKIYLKRGFCIMMMLMDGQLDGIQGELAEIGITLNMVA